MTNFTFTEIQLRIVRNSIKNGLIKFILHFVNKILNRRVMKLYFSHITIAI
jgi:hypothetical protein